MIRNIIYTVIFAVIVTVSWQVGSIFFEKQNIGMLLDKHANSTKQYNYYDGMIKDNLEKDLKHHGLPAKFQIQVLREGRFGSVRISYQYNQVASVFGYPYYQVDETITAETESK